MSADEVEVTIRLTRREVDELSMATILPYQPRPDSKGSSSYTLDEAKVKLRTALYAASRASV